ncbi:MAG: mycofactocin system FadH/OYE family oxidoreductase 2 [Desulfobacteraceae bacterium]|nr:mycofactocin system FadH/OYE family oxidoreductase 2 [Desulfobacteraceae bacterium]
MNRYKYLFSPLKIGPAVVPNRINFAAHMTNLSVNQQISDAHVAYYAERAKGGCGLITTEELSVHPSDLAYAKLVEAFDPEVVPGFQKLTQAVHKYGTKIFAQLNHNGMQAEGKISRLPVWGPSAGRDPIFRETAKEMEIEDIKDCIAHFAKSAGHAKEGGFDGIELQVGHSSLIRQFLSPATNFRQDEYGGSLENRVRFALEVTDAVRSAVGRELAVGLRLNADEMHPKGGLTLEAVKEIAVRLEQTGQIDFFDISLGTFHHLFLVEGSMHTPLAYATPLSAGIRSKVNLPVYASNRINDPHLAEKILEDGHGDMINMVRALIADPRLPNKARMGRDDDIRHCIACNQGCIGRMGLGYIIGCIQNPAAGHELEFVEESITSAGQPKKVIIVGAGPAGLEAARVAALRKHQVIVFESEQEVGGQNRLASSLPGRQEIEGIIRWLVSQTGKLPIDWRLGVKADKDAISKENPDAVVLATGSRPKEKPFPGDYGPPQVITTWQILKGGIEPGGQVLLIDLNGHHHGTGIAELLADQGKKVHVLTPALFQGSALGPLQDLYLTRQRLTAKGVVCTPDIAVLEINGTVVKGLNVYSNEIFDFEGYDTVVLAAGNIADDGLYFELKGELKELYRIGDCVAPRLTDMAIVEGNRLGRRL